MEKVPFLVFSFIWSFQVGISQIETTMDTAVAVSTGLITLAEDSIAEPFSFRTGFNKPVFFPQDLREYYSPNEEQLHIRRLKGAVVAIPEGTGRIYQFRANHGAVRFERIDQTRYSGYSFGAYLFVFKDTLFSFGGYGFWKHNGLLRFYDEQSGGWEVKPLKNEIPAHSLGNSLGQWVDRQEGYLYHIYRNLQNPDAYFQDTTKVYRLDLANKQWKEMGALTKSTISHLNGAVKIAELPDGDLISCGNGGQTILLVSYNKNAIFQLGKNGSRRIHAAIYTGNGNKFSWVNNSMLLIGDGFIDSLSRIEISETSFIRLPGKVYNPSNGLTAFFEDWGMLLTILGAGAGLGFITAKFHSGSLATKNINQPQSLAPVENLLNPYEINILRGFLKNPEQTMLPEEVNVLLETDRKSVEVQKKYRSEAIRGINEKCGKLLCSANPIIIQERLSGDRRQFLYRLDQDLCEALRQRTLGL